MYIVRKVERFRVHLEGGIGFKNNEVIDLFIKLVMSDFENIKLDVTDELVIDLSALISSGVELPLMSLAEILSLARNHAPRPQQKLNAAHDKLVLAATLRVGKPT